MPAVKKSRRNPEEDAILARERVQDRALRYYVAKDATIQSTELYIRSNGDPEHIVLLTLRLLVGKLRLHGVQLRVHRRLNLAPRAAQAHPCSAKAPHRSTLPLSCQARRALCATVSKTKELKKLMRPRENRFVSFGSLSPVRAALLSSPPVVRLDGQGMVRAIRNRRWWGAARRAPVVKCRKTGSVSAMRSHAGHSALST